MSRDSLVKGVAVFFALTFELRPTEKRNVFRNSGSFLTSSGGWPSEVQALGFAGTT